VKNSRYLAQLVLLFVFFPETGGSQALTLEAQPGSIAVAPSYSEVQTRVILKNTTSNAITKPSLSFLSNDGLQVELGEPSSKLAQPGQIIVWPVKIKNIGAARIPGSILFDATYHTSKTNQHSFTVLSLTPIDASQKSVEASLEGNFDAVSEQRPGLGYLVVTNNLDVPVDITVNPFVPENVFQIPSVPSTFKVRARSMAKTAIELKAAKRITPGTYPVLLELTAEWNWGNHKEQRLLVVSKQASAGVFFESELLKALGVPSFLVLPGCLVLFTMQLFITLGFAGLKNESRLPQLTVNTPGFWVLAITFSGLFAFAYYFCTGNNYLIRYGLDDLRNVWLSSILIGAILVLVIGGVTSKQRRDRVPTSHDSPVSVLKKIAKNGLSILLTEVRFKFNNLDLHGFVIERIDDGQQLVWIAPAIITSWGASQDALDAQKQFQDDVNARKSPLELAKELEEAAKKGYVQVYWDTQASIPNPFHLKIDAITEYRQPGVIVN